MTWLQAIGAICQVVLKLIQILQQNQLISAGEAQAISQAQEKTNEEVQKALAARRAAAAGKLPDDDSYLRD